MSKYAQSGLKRLPLAIAVVAALHMGAAFAQDQDQSDADQTTTQQQTDNQDNEDQDNAQELGAITVTGSLLRHPEYQTTVPIQTIDIQTAVQSGSFSTAAMLQSTAVASGTTQINNQFSGYIVSGGVGVQPIDLRGLGALRTLVLLDGQRPGPSGTRGQVGAFDLNVVPQAILSRVEIVKDGSSSIYGSDAVAGVVNLITRKRLDHPVFSVSMSIPQHGGGQQLTASAATGWNFESGNLMVAAQFQKQFPLALGDRDYLSCSRDMYWDANGNRIDSRDLSVLAGTDLAGCDNLYANTIIWYPDPSVRYVPSRDGHTEGPFPGYHPRPSPSPQYGDPDNPLGAYYEDVLNFPFYDDAWAINKNQNASLYGATTFNFGNIVWDTQALYNHRETDTRGWRQFFPIVTPNNEPIAAGLANVYQIIAPYPSNNSVSVDYLYVHSKLAGLFTGTNTWAWEANASYSRSDGDYSGNSIAVSKTGDLGYADSGLATVDYFDPCILSGECMDKLVNAIGINTTGNTVYTQSILNGLVTGDLFELPAGPVSAAFGAEYRHYEIDDQPPAASKNGDLWGETSADVTAGDDRVTEAFVEVGIPLVEGVPGFDSLVLDLSARTFKYDIVDQWDNVWKIGLNWQITPAWRVRATQGTSYRAPGLYELYLGDQTGFLGQFGIDPCILWGESSNQFLRANCEAAGIPADYDAPASTSATIHAGGGAGFLEPETSKARSLGVIWTPAFGNFNMALDYYDYRVEGTIATLSASAIVFGCYGREIYPNAFCDLLVRNPPNAPAHANEITDVYATYININQRRTRGYDLQFNYDQDFSFGRLSADAQVTYIIEQKTNLFDPALESGFATNHFEGSIGNPQVVGLAHLSLTRGDWTYTWQGRYIGETEAKGLSGFGEYAGYEGAEYDKTAGWQFLNSVSATYHPGKWSLLVGVRNLFDRTPDLISAGVAGRRGNIPLSASQYDIFGRTLFTRLNYSF